jgi:HK97 family phage major capsid protein
MPTTMKKVMSRRRPQHFAVEALERAEGQEWTLYRIAASSEEPVQRWYGSEVLSHKRGSVDLARFKLGASVRDEHDGPVVGVIERATVDDDRILRVDVRFSRNEEGQKVERDVVDKIRQLVSIRYIPLDERTLSKDQNGVEVREITRWQPVHLAFVADPADFRKAGVGREADLDREYEVAVEEPEPIREEERAMPEQVIEKPAPAASPVDARATDGAVQVADRNKEVEKLLQLAASHNVPTDKATSMIARGLSLQEAGLEILELTKTPARAQPAADPTSSLSKQDRKDRLGYSYRRALAMGANLRMGGKLDGVEGELHTELERNLPNCVKRSEGLGILVPLRLLPEPEPGARSRAMGTDVAGAGGELVFDAQPRELLEVLRARTIALRMGATLLTGLTGPVPFPKLTSDPTVYWRGENPSADTPESDLGTDILWLNPKTLQGNVKIPKQLLTISNFDIENRIRRILGIGHGQAIDRGCLFGKGSEFEPLGVWNTPGVAVVAIGGLPAYGKLVDMSTALASANADIGALGYATTPEIAGKLRQTLEFSAAGSTKIWTGDNENGQVAGYRASASNLVRKDLGAGANEHGLLFGNWEDEVVGMFGDALEILVDPYVLAAKGQVRVLTFQMADSLTQRPESFCKGTGATLGA